MTVLITSITISIVSLIFSTISVIKLKKIDSLNIVESTEKFNKMALKFLWVSKINSNINKAIIEIYKDNLLRKKETLDKKQLKRYQQYYEWINEIMILTNENKPESMEKINQIKEKVDEEIDRLKFQEMLMYP